MNPGSGSEQPRNPVDADTTMRIIFAGTPDFAAMALAGLISHGADVIAVYSQPDRRAGRGKKLKPGPVKLLAEEHNIDVYQPERFDEQAIREWRSHEADLAVVAAYGLLLPPDVLDAPRLGCVNIHASLLPRWRGAAPINRAIEAGDRETGITLMQMDEGLDTGAMLAKATVPVTETTTAAELHDTLAALGARLLVENLAALERRELKPVPQSEDGTTYARKLSKAESPVNWTLDAADIARRIRAFVPWPVATSVHQETVLKLWDASHSEDPVNAPPGTVVSADRNGIEVAAGRGVVSLQRLQRPGAKPVDVRDFLNGYPIKPGERFDTPQDGS